MADLIGTPVATQIKPMPGMSLSDIVGMAGNLQSLQQAAKINPLVLEQQKAAAESAKMNVSESKMKKIASSQISMINNPLVIRAEQDPSSVDPKMLADLVTRNGLETAKGMGIAEDQARQLLQPYIERAMQDPSTLRSYYKERHIQGLDEAARTSVLTPQMKDITGFAPTGEKVTQGVNINPFAGAVGQPVGPSSFAGPGMEMQLTGETDPKTGLPIAAVRDVRTGQIRRVTVPGGMFGTPPTFGGGAPAGQMPGGVDMTQPVAPGAGAAGRVPVGPPPPVPEYGAPGVYTPPTAAGGAGGIEASQTLFNQTRQAAASAPMERQNSNKIIQLADKSLTGSAAGALAALGGGLAAVPWTADEVSNRQELGHYLSQQTAQLAASAGLAGTDAARHIAGEMAGDITWTAPAIKKTARTNRALTAANEMLYQGMAMAAQANPNDREIANKYRDAWVSKLGVNGVDAIRLSDAYNNRDLDPEGVQQIVKEFGGVNSSRFKSIMKKAEELNRMMGQ
jgi:hypothetical protein